MEKKEERVRSGLVVIGMQEAQPHTLVHRYRIGEYLPEVTLVHGISHFIKKIDGDSLDIYFSKPIAANLAIEHFKFANMAMIVVSCTESLADCLEFVKSKLEYAPTENYSFIIVIAQSECIGTLRCKLTNSDAKILFNTSQNIEALFWCSAMTGSNVNEAFSHALWNKERIESPFFNQAFEEAKTHLQQYKGFKLNAELIGPVKFFHSRCNSTKHLSEIITLYQQLEITNKSAKQLTRIIFDHYTIIQKTLSDLSLCLERILVDLLGHIGNHNLNEAYQLNLRQRHTLITSAKSDDFVYSWLLTLCETYEIPPENSVAIKILEYVQTLETTLHYKCAGKATQLGIEHLIKFSCHFIDQLYKDQFNGLENNLAQLRKEYEAWADKFPHIDTSRIAEILKIAHIRLTGPDDDADEDMLVYNF